MTLVFISLYYIQSILCLPEIGPKDKLHWGKWTGKSARDLPSAVSECLLGMSAWLDSPQVCQLGSELGPTCILWLPLFVSSLANQCRKETEAYLGSFREGSLDLQNVRQRTEQFSSRLESQLTQIWSRTVLRIWFEKRILGKKKSTNIFLMTFDPLV